MQKRFHITGNCVPEKHYMVDISDKLDNIIENYIKPGSYFTINRARQYGKTTTLGLLEKKLKPEYLVLNLSFESVDDYFLSPFHLANGLIMDIGDALLTQDVPTEILTSWNRPVSELFPMRDLSKRITELCRNCSKKIVLMIDEVDKSSNNQIFLSFLALLREKYQKQLAGKDDSFQSVILAGVYNIKNLKLRLHPDEETKNNSPWNIAADFLVDMSFSAKNIEAMLRDYESDHQTGMNTKEISQLLYDYTSGYPYLVSRICQIIDERIIESDPERKSKNCWTREDFLTAVRMLQKEPNSLFDDMIKKLHDHPQLKTMVKKILFQGTRYTFEADSPNISLGVMFGFLKEKENCVAISNRIFETKLYNYFLSEEEIHTDLNIDFPEIQNQFVVYGSLQMDLVMRKFYEYYENIFANADEKFIEEEGRRIFLLYLRPIINGTGNYYIEAQTRDKTRTDVIVDYKGQRFIIEMKIWRGQKYNQDGRDQLVDYLNYYQLDSGYLLSFNFNKKKAPGVQEIFYRSKKIIEIIV